MEKQNTNTCQWSGIQLPPNEIHTFPTLGTKKLGCFADVNCLLAYLEHEKPRNYQQKINILQVEPYNLASIERVPRAPKTGWSLSDPRRVVCEALKKNTPNKKRKSNSAFSCPQSNKKFKVNILDTETLYRNETFYTDDWKKSVCEAGYDMNHPMPGWYSVQRPNNFVICPKLKCCAKTMKATPCKVTVTIQ